MKTHNAYNSSNPTHLRPLGAAGRSGTEVSGLSATLTPRRCHHGVHSSLVPAMVFFFFFSSSLWPRDSHSQSATEDCAGAAVSRVRFPGGGLAVGKSGRASGVLAVMAKSNLGQDPDSTAAVAVLKRAVELDAESRYQQALVCYQEGIDMLLQVLKGELVSVSCSIWDSVKLKKTKLTKHSNSGAIL